VYYLTDLDELNKRDAELRLNDYYFFDNGFSDEECAKIIKDNIDNLATSQQEHTNQDKQNKSCDIGFSQGSLWIYDKICNFAREANRISWDFLVNGICENIELIQYSGETKDSDAPRIDIGNNFNINFKQYRKISFYVALNSPEEYEGGEHLIHNYGTPIYAKKDLGSCVLFPSFMLNGVTPVTKGKKYCLRGYIFGPHFK